MERLMSLLIQCVIHTSVSVHLNLGMFLFVCFFFILVCFYYFYVSVLHLYTVLARHCVAC